MKRKHVLTVLIFLAMSAAGYAVYSGHNLPPQNYPEYMQWLHENGLSLERKSGGIHLRVTYLPSEYMAWRELQNRDRYSAQTRDSLITMFDKSRAFLLSIAPDTAQASGNVMFKDVENYADYSEKVKVMNFGLEEYLELRNGANRMAPAFSIMENSYNVDDARKVLLLFTPAQGEPEIDRKQDMDLVFYDEIFQSGIHHFRFKAEQYAALPPFPFVEK